MTHSIFDADVPVDRQRSNGSSHRPHPGFGYDVDGTSYTYDQPTITGAQLRFVAGIYPQQVLVRILDDGARVTVSAADTVSLVSGTARFRRRPRFKRN
ncbi:multiubiquitin domain-containing protein [Jatrophihabitans sp.]|jgi:hypothetical protein|uniref:multiubiquitin domain-containing protein n=1 Tax=Jatrophihabitans sp. TaxID=1932789 RepID=UPI002F11709A